MTPDAGITFWRHAPAILGTTPYSNGQCVVHIAIGQVTTWDMDCAWMLKVSLVHGMHGLFIIKITAMIILISIREKKYLLVTMWGRSRLNAQQADDPRPFWRCGGVDSPDGAMSDP